MVNTITLQHLCPWFKYQPGHYLLDFACSPCVFVWVFSGYSSFLLHSKDMLVICSYLSLCVPIGYAHVLLLSACWSQTCVNEDCWGNAWKTRLPRKCIAKALKCKWHQCTENLQELNLSECRTHSCHELCGYFISLECVFFIFWPDAGRCALAQRIAKALPLCRTTKQQAKPAHVMSTFSSCKYTT